jgi:hypothetical protein
MRIEGGLWQAAPIGLTFPWDRIDIWRLCPDSFESPEPDFSEILSQDEFARASRVTFLLRKDGDFCHFYFCSASPMALQRGAATFTERKTERAVTGLDSGKDFKTLWAGKENE